MPKNKKEKTAEERAEAIKKITPEMIVMDDDSDMPAPETKVYKKYIKVNDIFMNLFYKCVNSLPYKTVLRNSKGSTMELNKFVPFVENNRNKIEVNDMNIILSYIDSLDYAHARPMMDVINDKEKQGSLWTIFEE
jgi:hypothetical protein